MDWAKTTAREHKKYLNFEIWCDLTRGFTVIPITVEPVKWDHRSLKQKHQNFFISLTHFLHYSPCCEKSPVLRDQKINWTLYKVFTTHLNIGQSNDHLKQ